MAALMWKICSVSNKTTLFNTKCMIVTTRLQKNRCNSILAHKLIYSEYGDPVKVIKHEEENIPLPVACQVVVRMLAAPVNPADINTIQGVYAIKPTLPSIPGNEGVGEIEFVGSDVKNLKKGDRVLPKSSGLGTWRSRILCDEKEVLKISKDVGLVEAATLTVNPCTAYRMLRDFVCLKPGDSVIQNGANSACGQNVIQMCKAWGINSVNIVRKRENIDELKCFLTNLGATHVLTEEELRTTDIFKKKCVPRPRLALNCVGGKNALEVLRQLSAKGVMVTYGGMSREPVTVPTSALIFKDVIVRGFWMTRWSTENIDSPQRIEMLAEITQMMVSGSLKAPIHKMVPFIEFQEALINTMNMQGFAGLKYVLDFKSCS